MASKRGRKQKSVEQKNVEQKNVEQNSVEQKSVEQVGDWSELPYDILEMVLTKLLYIDQLKLRAVCKSWRAINGVPSLKQKLPWLLMFNIDKDDDDDDDDDDEYSCKASDLNCNKTYNMSMNIIKEKNLINVHVHESKNGWLLISSQLTPESPNGALSRYYPSGTSFFLFTPFLSHNNYIELPIHTSLFSIATFSSDPSSQDFIVLTMCSYSDTISIDTYCLGGDSSWKVHYFECDFPLVYVRSLVYTNGEFFCSSSLGTIGIFVVAQRDWIVLSAPETPLAAFETVADADEDIEVLDLYLVKSDTHKEDNEEEIFLVYVKNFPSAWTRFLMCLFRLDRSQMIWEKLESIGSRIMFLGSGCTSFVGEERSEKSNDRIYYICGNKMKYCPVPKANRSYPCNMVFGPLSLKPSTKIWIEPPRHC